MNAARTVSSSISKMASTKAVGDISSVFPSLAGKKAEVLPDRFIDLKHQILDVGGQDKVSESWKRLLSRLQGKVQEIKAQKSSVRDF